MQSHPALTPGELVNNQCPQLPGSHVAVPLNKTCKNTSRTFNLIFFPGWGLNTQSEPATPHLAVDLTWKRSADLPPLSVITPMNQKCTSHKKWNHTMNCGRHVIDFKLSLLAASAARSYPPYDIDSASNKYSYIHAAFLAEAMRSPFGWILDNTHTLSSIFNIHSPALMLHLQSKYLCTVWHEAKIKIIIIKSANNLPDWITLCQKNKKKNQC